MTSAILTLQPNLDELEWHNDESLSGTSSGAGKDREPLGHLGDAKKVPVDLAPLVVGSELGSTLGSFHEDGSRDTAVETRSTAPMSIVYPLSKDRDHPYPSFFTIFLMQSNMPV